MANDEPPLVLTGWKAIRRHLTRRGFPISVKTLRSRYRDRGLPVTFNRELRQVFASPEALDEWVRSYLIGPPPPEPPLRP